MHKITHTHTHIPPATTCSLKGHKVASLNFTTRFHFMFIKPKQWYPHGQKHRSQSVLHLPTLPPHDKNVALSQGQICLLVYWLTSIGTALHTTDRHEDIFAAPLCNAFQFCEQINSIWMPAHCFPHSLHIFVRLVFNSEHYSRFLFCWTDFSLWIDQLLSPGSMKCKAYLLNTFC